MLANLSVNSRQNLTSPNLERGTRPGKRDRTKLIVTLKIQKIHPVLCRLLFFLSPIRIYAACPTITRRTTGPPTFHIHVCLNSRA